MPDVPIKPRPEPEPTLAEKMEPAVTAARIAITGTPDGAVRRPILFALVGLGIVAALVLDGPVGLVLGGIAMIALLFLAWSDNVVIS